MVSWVKGGHTLKLKMVINLFLFKFLTRNTFALIHVSIIRICNKIKKKVKLVYFNNTSCAWLYSKQLQLKQQETMFSVHLISVV